MTEPEGEILPLEEAAAYLKVDKRTVDHLASEGKLSSFKLNNKDLGASG